MERNICWICLSRLATPSRSSLSLPITRFAREYAVSSSSSSSSSQSPRCNTRYASSLTASNERPRRRLAKDDQISEPGEGETTPSAAAAAAEKNEKLHPSAVSSHEKHLNSILSHPLFRLSQSSTTSSTSSASSTSPSAPRYANNATRPRTIPSLHSQQQLQSQSHEEETLHHHHHHQDPLATLDKLIATGRADHRALDRCLRQHFKDLLHPPPHSSSSSSSSSSPPNSITAQSHLLATSPASATIQAWYNSAPWDSRIAAFGDRATMAIVMPYLVCAGQQEVVLAWLSDIADNTDLHARWVLQSRRSEENGVVGRGKEFGEKGGSKSSSTTTTTTTNTTTADNISRLLLAPKRSDCVQNVLIELLAAELRYTGDLAAAINYLSRACVMFASAGSSSSSSSATPPQLTEARMILDTFKTTEDYRTSIPLRSKTSPFRRAAIYLATYISDHSQSLASPSPSPSSLQQRTIHISPKSFDRFQSILSRLLSDNHFWSSLTPLYHPQTPSAALALHYGKLHFGRYHAPSSSSSSSSSPAGPHHLSKGHGGTGTAHPHPHSPPTSRQRHYLLRMCLQAAQVCLEQGRQAEAGWFLGHAKAFLDPVERRAGVGVGEGAGVRGLVVDGGKGKGNGKGGKRLASASSGFEGVEYGDAVWAGV